MLSLPISEKGVYLFLTDLCILIDSFSEFAEDCSYIVLLFHESRLRKQHLYVRNLVASAEKTEKKFWFEKDFFRKKVLIFLLVFPKKIFPNFLYCIEYHKTTIFTYQ